MVVLVCAYALVLALIVSVVVALGQLAVLVPSYASEIDDYVQDVGGWLDRAGMGSDQVAAATDAVDTGRLVDLVTGILSGVLALLSNLFFLVALHAVPRLRRLQVPGAGRRGASGAPGGSSTRWRRSRTGRAATSRCRRSSA